MRQWDICSHPETSTSSAHACDSIKDSNVFFCLLSIMSQIFPSPLSSGPKDKSYRNNISWAHLSRILYFGPLEMQCWIHPHVSQTSWSTTFRKYVGETTVSLPSQTGLDPPTEIQPPGVLLNSAQPQLHICSSLDFLRYAIWARRP